MSDLVSDIKNMQDSILALDKRLTKIESEFKPVEFNLTKDKTLEITS